MNEAASLTSAIHRPRRQRDLPVGVDWVLRGVVSSETGADVVLVSKAEPIPGIEATVERYAVEIDECGVAVEFAESDPVVAGLLRAGLLARRRMVALFEMRGMRQAVDALYDACRIRVSPRGAGVIVLCHSRGGSGVRQEASRPQGIEASRHPPSAIRHPPSATRDPSPWHIATRLVIADPRDLATYLDIPIVAPATPVEVARYVNEAMRLSRAAGSVVMLYLSPSLMGGGETDPHMTDPIERGVPTQGPGVRGQGSGTLTPLDSEQHGTPLQVEARRRRLDRLLNAPLAGERVGLGFITFGAAHAALRHALNMLGLTGRLPILKLGYANPVDPRSVEHFLTRCESVIVVEGGRPIIEQSILTVARELSLRGHHVAEVYGKRLPAPVERAAAAASLPLDLELHPSELVERLGDLLLGHRPAAGATSVDEALREARNLAEPSERLAFDLRPSPRIVESLVQPLIDSVLDDLRDEFSVATADRPALDLTVDSLETAMFETTEGQRQVILIDRRRLPTVGRAAIAHALRRRQPATFLILPDLPGRESGVSTADADRLVRSVISEREAAQARVSSMDPSDMERFRRELAQEIASPAVCVVILDLRRPREPENVAGHPSEWSHLGYAPIESVVRPSSSLASLCYSWLVRHGWDDPAWLDGIHGPRLEFPDPDDPLITPLDSWAGFEEYRAHRRRPPTLSTLLSERLDAPDPTPRHQHSPLWRAHVCGRIAAQVDDAVRLVESAGRRMGYRVQMLRGRNAIGVFAQIVFSRPRPNEPPLQVTAHIPWGCADLVVALDLDSLIEAVERSGGQRVASPQRTSLVLDLSPPPTAVLEGAAGRRFIVPGELNAIIPPASRLTLRAGEICDHILKTRRLLGTVLASVAFQRGLIPVTAQSMVQHIEATEDDPLGQRLLAFRFGRALVSTLAGEIPLPEPKSPSPESLIRRHRAVMARRLAPRAATKAEQFARLALGTLDAVTGLRRSDPSRAGERAFIARLVDCERWGGLTLCRRYTTLISAVYAAERSVTNYPVTRFAIEELARALLIADPVFLARTILRRDRLREAARALRLDRGKGDRLSVRVRGQIDPRFTPGFGAGYWSMGPIGVALLGLLAPLRALPWWYRRDREYREWVERLVDRCIGDLPQRSSLWLEVFRQLTRVRGHGPRRLRRIRRVRTAVQSMLDLAGTNATSEAPSDAPSGASSQAPPIEESSSSSDERVGFQPLREEQASEKP